MKLFTKHKRLPEEWKRVRKEKLLKIRRRIQEILDKEHSITAKEKGWRDWFFRPLSKKCRDWGIRANYVSEAGVVFVLTMIHFLSTGDEVRGLLFALMAVFSDMIDGPIARFKYSDEGPDGITAFGTFLDHFRDYFLVIAFGYFSFFYHNTFYPVEATIFTLIVLLYVGIFVGTFLKLRRYKLPVKSPEGKFHGFLLPEMQTSFWGRAQFFCIIVGTVVLFLGRMNEIPYLIYFSYIVFGIHIGVNFRNLLEEYIVDA